jgi:hypothetical protein
MTESIDGLGLQINKIWMGSREASKTASLAAWVAAVVIYIRADAHAIVYPLNLSQATQLRDRLLLLGSATKPKTAGERYLASKARMGLSFKFDDETDGIFVGDRHASPEGLVAGMAGSISFKAHSIDGVHCNQLTADEFAMFGRVLVEVIAGHVEPPDEIEA